MKYVIQSRYGYNILIIRYTPSLSPEQVVYGEIHTNNLRNTSKESYAENKLLAQSCLSGSTALTSVLLTRYNQLGLESKVLKTVGNQRAYRSHGTLKPLSPSAQVGIICPCVQVWTVGANLFYDRC